MLASRFVGAAVFATANRIPTGPKRVRQYALAVQTLASTSLRINLRARLRLMLLHGTSKQLVVVRLGPARMREVHADFGVRVNSATDPNAPRAVQRREPQIRPILLPL